MYPEFTIPFVGRSVSAHVIFIGLAAAVCLLIAPGVAARLAGIDPARTRRMLPLIAIAPWVGGRIHYVANYWYAYADHLGAALGSWPSGLHAPGAVGAVAIVLPIVCWRHRVPLGAFADGITPTVALGIAIARLGCFLQGCCFGTRCEGWWCVTFPASTGPVHPLQLYFAANALVVIAVVLWLIPRKAYDGQPALVGLLVLVAGHAALEFLRFDGPGRVYWGPLPQLEWTLLVMTGVAAAALAITYATSRARRPGAPAGQSAERCLPTTSS